MTFQIDSVVLTAALEGLELQRQRLDARVDEVKRLLKSAGTSIVTTSLETVTASSDAQVRPRKKFSAATRKKMALAQKKRYAALKGQTEPEQAAATQPARAIRKRKLSAAGLANIRAAVAKRWAKAKSAKNAPVATKKVAAKKSATKKSAPVAAKKAVAKKASRKSAGTAKPAPVTVAATTA